MNLNDSESTCNSKQNMINATHVALHANERVQNVARV